jgi:hypothetical protein
MWRARTSHPRFDDGDVVRVTIWLPAPPRHAAAPLPPPRPAREGAPLRADSRPRAMRAPVIDAPALAQAASTPPAPASVAPQVPASAASQPLNLTLTREQLRAIVAASKPTLAQSLARSPRASALARLGGDDTPEEEVQLPGGVTEVHIHGGCFRLVPTPRAQYDPFNHANERLTAACR